MSKTYNAQVAHGRIKLPFDVEHIGINKCIWCGRVSSWGDGDISATIDAVDENEGAGLYADMLGQATDIILPPPRIRYDAEFFVRCPYCGRKKILKKMTLKEYEIRLEELQSESK